MAQDVLRDVDDDEVARVAAADRLDVVDDRAGHLAVGAVDRLERHRDLAPGPVPLERLGLVGIDIDGERLERLRARCAGIGERTQRRLVDPGDQDDGVDPRGQELDLGVPLGRGDLLGDPAVVAGDALHHDEEHRHRRDRDPGAVGELGDEDDDEDDAGHRGADGVDDPAAHHPTTPGRVPLEPQQSVPVTDHADLACRERHEDADDVELDEATDLGVEGEDEDDRGQRQDDDAVGEGEPVATILELAREVAVLGQDRGEHREAVERGVGREHEDDAGHRDRDVEGQREVVEDRLRELADDRLLGVGRAVRELEHARGDLLADLAVLGESLHVGGRVDVADPGAVGQRDDADEHGDRDATHEEQGGGGVLALGLLEGRDAVGDRLDPGEGGAAGRERAQEQEEAGGRREAAGEGRVGDDIQVGALGLGQGTGRRSEEPPEGHADDGDHEAIGRKGEGRPRLADPAQVHGGEQHDQPTRDEGLVAIDERDRRRRVLDARRDRHRDREDVVDEQRARDGQTGEGADVGVGHLVVATTGGIGVDVLPIGHDDDEHHDGDGQADLPREGVGRQSGDREGDEDFVGRVGDRRQRVARKHRQGDLLRQQGLAEAVAAHGPTQDDALDDAPARTHVEPL